MSPIARRVLSRPDVAERVSAALGRPLVPRGLEEIGVRAALTSLALPTWFALSSFPPVAQFVRAHVEAAWEPLAREVFGVDDPPEAKAEKPPRPEEEGLARFAVSRSRLRARLLRPAQGRGREPDEPVTEWIVRSAPSPSEIVAAEPRSRGSLLNSIGSQFRDLPHTWAALEAMCALGTYPEAVTGKLLSQLAMRTPSPLPRQGGRPAHVMSRPPARVVAACAAALCEGRGLPVPPAVLDATLRALCAKAPRKSMETVAIAAMALAPSPARAVELLEACAEVCSVSRERVLKAALKSDWEELGVSEALVTAAGARLAELKGKRS